MKAIHVILEEVSKAKTKKAKKEILLANDHLVLRDVLRGAFDNTVFWNLPNGEVPTEMYKAIGSPVDLYRKGDQLRYFVRYGPGHGMPAVMREKKFFEFLNSIHPEDIPVIMAMKDKRLDKLYTGIDKKLIQETWPKLISV